MSQEFNFVEDENGAKTETPRQTFNQPKSSEE